MRKNLGSQLKWHIVVESVDRKEKSLGFWSGTKTSHYL
jgi:hypothetical protein